MAETTPGRPKSKRIAILGVIFFCLGVVFLRSGKLGAILMTAGAIMVIVGLIKRKS